MTNEEIKKKIVEILNDVTTEPMIYKGRYLGDTQMPELKINAIADALIAAGIGDVKEADRRAEVAERALKDMCEEYEDNFECDLYKECNSDKPCYLCDYKVRLQKAAREIEEGKGK